jgi:hypothetical protein
MRKLACDLPVDAAARPDARVAAARARAAPELFSTMGDALRRRKRVTFTYHTMGSDATAPRTVEPFGLFFLNQHWYLAARTPGEETVKNYRLGRITDAEANAKQPATPDYEIPAGFDLQEHARSRQAWELGTGDAVTAVVALLNTSGAAVAAHRLGEAVDGDERLRRFRVRRVDSFARWLLSFARRGRRGERLGAGSAGPPGAPEGHPRGAARASESSAQVSQGRRAGVGAPGHLSIRDRLRQRDVVHRRPLREQRWRPVLPARPSGRGRDTGGPVRPGPTSLGG